ncbi:MAG: hypothetical protein IPP80_02675 [Ignavibacteria bacterium]|nr:hypothetical protein [Ignavibacteria bacterium]
MRIVIIGNGVAGITAARHLRSFLTMRSSWCRMKPHIISLVRHDVCVDGAHDA